MRILLLGAGHCHLDVIRRAGELTRRGHSVAVISPGDFWYSGLATGVLGGQYPPSRDRVDVGDLCAAGGAEYVDDRVERADPSRLVITEGGREVPYDVLSVDLGSVVRPLPGQETAGNAVFGIKPISALADLRRAVERRAGGPVRAVVVGAGYSGCEIAANLHALGGGKVLVTLLAAGGRLMEGRSQSAARVAERSLRRRGVDVRFDARVERIEAGAATFNGGQVPFDLLINATGLHAPPVLRRLGLPLDEGGYLRVDESLRSVGDGRVFGTGDCISFAGHHLPKNGVFAVREAPVLFDNLLATAEGRAVRPFRPQSRYLLVMNLADGTGLATWGGWHYHGKLALKAKRWLDARFLKKFE